ncbi:MAG: glycosyltransferase [Ignavibacteriaceae bacterium]|nr:glycosyltransferase [Ignavibacteriaceae bacterium]
MKEKSVLFIADGPLSNPILLSQGIPHIRINSSEGIKYFLLSFENPALLEQDKNASERDKKCKELLSGKAVLIAVNAPFYRSKLVQNSGILRALRFFLMILNGILVARRTVKKEKIDIIHCRSNFPAFIGVIVSRLTGARTLFDNRGVVSAEASGKLSQKILLELEKFLIKKSDLVVVVSNKFKEYITEELLPGRVDPAKITVIENGFSPERINFNQERRNEIRRQLGIENRNVLIYSGTLSKWQMFDEICDTFLEYKKNDDSVFFLVLTPNENEATHTISKKGIAGSDFKVLNITGNDLGDYLSAGETGVLFRQKNLINRVSAPIKFSEYLGAGLAVLITAGIGDTSEIINEYPFGVIVNEYPKDLPNALKTLQEIIKKPESQKLRAERAKKQLTVEISAKKFYCLYKKDIKF